MSLLGALGAGPDTLICSRAGCIETARWSIVWRNPKIHDETRRKTWLACDAHREFLTEFLSAREFPLTVEPA